MFRSNLAAKTITHVLVLKRFPQFGSQLEIPCFAETEAHFLGEILIRDDRILQVAIHDYTTGYEIHRYDPPGYLNEET